jgi:hypothetical protein
MQCDRPILLTAQITGSEKNMNVFQVTQALPDLKSGVILRLHDRKQIATILGTSRDVKGVRYFMHYERVVKGPIHFRVGDQVLFNVLTQPVTAGKLPIAFDVVFLREDDDNADVLADADALATPLAGQNGNKAAI